MSDLFDKITKAKAEKPDRARAAEAEADRFLDERDTRLRAEQKPKYEAEDRRKAEIAASTEECAKRGFYYGGNEQDDYDDLTEDDVDFLEEKAKAFRKWTEDNERPFINISDDGPNALIHIEAAPGFALDELSVMRHLEGTTVLARGKNSIDTTYHISGIYEGYSDHDEVPPMTSAQRATVKQSVMKIGERVTDWFLNDASLHYRVNFTSKFLKEKVLPILDLQYMDWAIPDERRVMMIADELAKHLHLYYVKEDEHFVTYSNGIYVPADAASMIRQVLESNPKSQKL